MSLFAVIAAAVSVPMQHAAVGAFWHRALHDSSTQRVSGTSINPVTSFASIRLISLMLLTRLVTTSIARAATLKQMPLPASMQIQPADKVRTDKLNLCPETDSRAQQAQHSHQAQCWACLLQFLSKPELCFLPCQVIPGQIT
ncbi:TPA: hypothetical protein ACH3X1_013125 [Trebouxia sp. C0004]